jgi:hypothetical protein
VYSANRKGAKAPLPEIGTIYFIGVRFSKKEKYKEWPAMAVRHTFDGNLKVLVLTDTKIHTIIFVVGRNGALGTKEKGVEISSLKYANKEDYLVRARDIGMKLRKAVA